MSPERCNTQECTYPWMCIFARIHMNLHKFSALYNIKLCAYGTYAHTHLHKLQTFSVNIHCQCWHRFLHNICVLKMKFSAQPSFTYAHIKQFKQFPQFNACTDSYYDHNMQTNFKSTSPHNYSYCSHRAYSPSATILNRLFKLQISLLRTHTLL